MAPPQEETEVVMESPKAGKVGEPSQIETTPEKTVDCIEVESKTETKKFTEKIVPEGWWNAALKTCMNSMFVGLPLDIVAAMTCCNMCTIGGAICVGGSCGDNCNVFYSCCECILPMLCFDIDGILLASPCMMLSSVIYCANAVVCCGLTEAIGDASAPSICCNGYGTEEQPGCCGLWGTTKEPGCCRTCLGCNLAHATSKAVGYSAFSNIPWTKIDTGEVMRVKKERGFVSEKAGCYPYWVACCNELNE